LSLPQREGQRDHKSQTEQKRTPEEIRLNGCRLFIHFGLSPLIFVYFFEISRETLLLFTALGSAILE
jgi:hypothetical protein